LNATCPHVGKVQGIIHRHAKDGYSIVILGEKDHAEVIGLLGYARGKGYVVNSLKSWSPFPRWIKSVWWPDHPGSKTLPVPGRWGAKEVPRGEDLQHHLRLHAPEQEEVLALAKKVEAIVVVGGKGSGNTRRLARISEEAGVPTFHVETEKDLDLQALSGYAVIGVTAGASTPNWLILRVVDRIHELRGRGGAASHAETLGRLRPSAIFSWLSGGLFDLRQCPAPRAALELSSVFIAALYVFSMHVLNRLADKASENFNQPGGPSSTGGTEPGCLRRIASARPGSRPGLVLGTFPLSPSPGDFRLG